MDNFNVRALADQLRGTRQSPDFDALAIAAGLGCDGAPGNGSFLPTTVMRHLMTRMQRTHDKRRASVFIGPVGIGKSTAIEAFRRANSGSVAAISLPDSGRGVTGPQALQHLLRALRSLRGLSTTGYITNANLEVQRYVEIEIEHLGSGLHRSNDPHMFPHVTVVFDEAQNLTSGALGALRAYNEPHYFCRGTFPIGFVFVGNNRLSLEARDDQNSVIDEAMADRLLYRERLTYEDVERSDLEAFVRAMGVADHGAVAAICEGYFGKFAEQRSFRRVSDFVDEVRDEAMGNPITAETVRTVRGLA